MGAHKPIYYNVALDEDTAARLLRAVTPTGNGVIMARLHAYRKNAKGVVGFQVVHVRYPGTSFRQVQRHERCHSFKVKDCETALPKTSPL
jgi:hypothetical protein